EDNNGAMTSQAVTISITGTNDGPTITSAVQAGSVTEDVAVSLPVLDGDVVIDAGGNLSTAGTVTFQDIDLIDTHTASFVLTSTDAAADLPGFAEGSGSGAANIGTFAIDSSVNESNSDTINTGSLGWSFTLNDGNAVLQSLAAGQVLTQVYTVTLEDNNGAMTSQAVTISITGTNDGPTITSAVQAGSVTEDVAVSLPVLDG